jgi:hypothetical protein
MVINILTWIQGAGCGRWNMECNVCIVTIYKGVQCGEDATDKYHESIEKIERSTNLFLLRLHVQILRNCSQTGPKKHVYTNIVYKYKTNSFVFRVLYMLWGEDILREPLSILIKYKTIDTPKIESILKNLFRRFDWTIVIIRKWVMMILHMYKYI